MGGVASWVLVQGWLRIQGWEGGRRGRWERLGLASGCNLNPGRGRLTHVGAGGDLEPGTALGPSAVLCLFLETGLQSWWKDRERCAGVGCVCGGKRPLGLSEPPCVCESLCISVWLHCGVSDDVLPLQELLAEWRLRRAPSSVCGRMRQAAVLGLVWLLCLAVTLGCTWAIYAFSEFRIKVRGLGGQPRGLWTWGQTPAQLGWVTREQASAQPEVSRGACPCAQAWGAGS